MRGNILLVIGLVLLVIAVVLALVGQTTTAVIDAVVALVLIFIWLFRRRARSGDFSRSGAAGL